METLKITANNQTVINKAEKFVIEDNMVFMKGLEGSFKKPFATDNATIYLNDIEINTGSDGYVIAKPIKWQLEAMDDIRAADYDEVYLLEVY